MGRSSYKRLGDYIQPVDIRNKECTVETLLGVSNAKEFIPSIANTIGTDMSNYKVITKGQFAYVTVTSRNGDKLSVALMQEEEAIVSQAYTVFEVVDKTELLPDYLMMWFRRPEFDRYARFKSHGSAREIFDWEEMCEVRLPIPDIEEQREIVAQYEAITRRIALNERICANLEETAQALYNKMFVQGIDPDNLPDGWRMGTLDEVGEIVSGATPLTDNPLFWSDNDISWLTPADISSQGVKFISKGERDITIDGYNSCSTKMIPKGGVLFSSRAPIGLMAIAVGNLCTNQGFKSVIPDPVYGTPFVYYTLLLNRDRIANDGSGSTFDEISLSGIKLVDLVIPPIEEIQSFNSKVQVIHDTQSLHETENKGLKLVRQLLINQLGNS